MMQKGDATGRHRLLAGEKYSTDAEFRIAGWILA
jgi:hypothetical protein